MPSMRRTPRRSRSFRPGRRNWTNSATELENLDIVGMVRSMGMTPEELAALIEASKNGQMASAMTEKEETGDEEN